MAVYFNESEAKLEKKSKDLNGFAYDDESQGGGTQNLTDAKNTIATISNDIEDLALKYNELQNQYTKFTSFNDTMNANKTALRNSIDEVKKSFDLLLDNLKAQLQGLEETDSELMLTLEGINKLIANSKADDAKTAERRSQDTNNNNNNSNNNSNKSNQDLNNIADDVIRGKYGTGEERKKKLREAGYDPDQVQDLVNRKLKGEDTSTPSNNQQATNNAEQQPANTENAARPEQPKEESSQAQYVNPEADTHNGTGEGPKLTSYAGTIDGPSGKETYYNLDMSGIVRESQPGGWIYNQAKANGNEGNLSNNIWVRDDGCKMMGDYIMVAADLNVHPRGSLVETSLGTGIVVDTGDFAATNHNQIDIATTW